MKKMELIIYNFFKQKYLSLSDFYGEIYFLFKVCILIVYNSFQKLSDVDGDLGSYRFYCNYVLIYLIFLVS